MGEWYFYCLLVPDEEHVSLKTEAKRKALSKIKFPKFKDDANQLSCRKCSISCFLLNAQLVNKAQLSVFIPSDPPPAGPTHCPA